MLFGTRSVSPGERPAPCEGIADVLTESIAKVERKHAAEAV